MMDFAYVLEQVVKQFDAQEVSFALMGGFALHVSGYTRSTQDLDFLVNLDHIDKVEHILITIGYKKIYANQDVSHYGGVGKRAGVLGNIDFLHAHRAYSLAMLSRAKRYPMLGGLVSVPILLAEDLIGLKVQATSNDPSRYLRDMADVQEIIKLRGQELDLNLIREYFVLFERETEFNDIIERINHVK